MFHVVNTMVPSSIQRLANQIRMKQIMPYLIQKVALLLLIT